MISGEKGEVANVLLASALNVWFQFHVYTHWLKAWVFIMGNTNKGAHSSHIPKRPIDLEVSPIDLNLIYNMLVAFLSDCFDSQGSNSPPNDFRFRSFTQLSKR